MRLVDREPREAREQLVQPEVRPLVSVARQERRELRALRVRQEEPALRELQELLARLAAPVSLEAPACQELPDLRARQAPREVRVLLVCRARAARVAQLESAEAPARVEQAERLVALEEVEGLERVVQLVRQVRRARLVLREPLVRRARQEPQAAADPVVPRE